MIGGGSTYTPELIEGFARRADVLPVDELCCRATGSRSSAAWPAGSWPGPARSGDRLRTTTELESAVDGAAAVLVQLRVGGQRIRLVDETRPDRFGLLGDRISSGQRLASR